MLNIFGFSFEKLPEEAFRQDRGFNCGFMTTEKSQSLGINLGIIKFNQKLGIIFSWKKL
jgi:hypothetical protein